MERQLDPRASRAAGDIAQAWLRGSERTEHRIGDLLAEHPRGFEAETDALARDREVHQPARARVDIRVGSEQEDRARSGLAGDPPARVTGPVGRYL